MTEQKVDLDLDVIAPEPRTFRFGGKVYKLPAEIPIPTTIDALRLHDVLTSAEPGTPEMIGALDELYKLELEIVQVHQPDVERLMLSERQMMRVFGLIVRGPDVELPEAILETLETHGAEGDEEGEVEKLPPTPRKPRATPRGGSGGRSRRRSPGASSV